MDATKIKQVIKMPASLLDKFGKYTTKLANSSASADQLLAMLKTKAEFIASKGINMKFLADDFFEGVVGNVRYSKILPGTITPYHCHDFYEINYIASGECVQYIDGKNIIMKAGDLLFIHPDAYHISCPVGDSIGYNILIRGDFFRCQEELFKKTDKNNYLTFLRNNKVYMMFHNILDNKAAEAIETLIGEIQNENKAPHTSFNNIYIENLTSNVFVALARCPRNDTMFRTGSHSIGEKEIDVILQYISDNISNITLEQTSQFFGYSGTHLSKLIKKYTGNSFVTHVTNQRILKAEALLAKTDVPISSIHQMVGLDSNEYFFRMFRRINGITPLAFRKAHSKETSIEIQQ